MPIARLAHKQSFSWVQLTAEQVRLGTLAAALEMIRGSVGVSADMYFFNEAGTALLEAGLKANVGLSVIRG